MKIGIPKEMLPDERRVAATPETVAKMVQAGMQVFVEADAGIYSHIADKEYKKAGAKIESNFEVLLKQSDVVLKVQRPIFEAFTHQQQIHYMKNNAVLIGFLNPLNFPDIISNLNEKKITAFSLDLLPRNATNQSMDALSSMSHIAGYKSVIIAAYYLGKIFNTITTPNGTIPPVKVLIIGAGTAGLHAITTARKLGASVTAMDNRPAVAEKVKSLDAEFVSLEVSSSEQEQSIIREYLKEADVVIASAQLPGERAPLLITEEMVQEMKSGSVIVDLAIEQQGNCALTQAGKVVVKHDVTIIGFLNIPSTVTIHSSVLYAQNIWAFLNYLTRNGKEIQLDLEDEITKSCLITHNGETVHPLVKQLLKKNGSAML